MLQKDLNVVPVYQGVVYIYSQWHQHSLTLREAPPNRNQWHTRRIAVTTGIGKPSEGDSWQRRKIDQVIAAGCLIQTEPRCRSHAAHGSGGTGCKVVEVRSIFNQTKAKGVVGAGDGGTGMDGGVVHYRIGFQTVAHGIGFVHRPQDVVQISQEEGAACLFAAAIRSGAIELHHNTVVRLVVLPEEFEVFAAIPLRKVDVFFHALRKTVPWAIIPRFAQPAKPHWHLTGKLSWPTKRFLIP